MVRGRIRTLVLSLLAAWSLPTAALAEYPDKPIRFIVPQAPGRWARTRWRRQRLTDTP